MTSITRNNSFFSSPSLATNLSYTSPPKTLNSDRIQNDLVLIAKEKPGNLRVKVDPVTGQEYLKIVKPQDRRSAFRDCFMLFLHYVTFTAVADPRKLYKERIKQVESVLKQDLANVSKFVNAVWTNEVDVSEFNSEIVETSAHLNNVFNAICQKQSSTWRGQHIPKSWKTLINIDPKLMHFVSTPFSLDSRTLGQDEINKLSTFDIKNPIFTNISVEVARSIKFDNAAEFIQILSKTHGPIQKIKLSKDEFEAIMTHPEGYQIVGRLSKDLIEDMLQTVSPADQVVVLDACNEQDFRINLLSDDAWKIIDAPTAVTQKAARLKKFKLECYSERPTAEDQVKFLLVKKEKLDGNITFNQDQLKAIANLPQKERHALFSLFTMRQLNHLIQHGKQNAQEALEPRFIVECFNNIKNHNDIIDIDPNLFKLISKHKLLPKLAPRQLSQLHETAQISTKQFIELLARSKFPIVGVNFGTNSLLNAIENASPKIRKSIYSRVTGKQLNDIMKSVEINDASIKAVYNIISQTKENLRSFKFDIASFENTAILSIKDKFSFCNLNFFYRDLDSAADKARLIVQTKGEINSTLTVSVLEEIAKTPNFESVVKRFSEDTIQHLLRQDFTNPELKIKVLNASPIHLTDLQPDLTDEEIDSALLNRTQFPKVVNYIAYRYPHKITSVELHNIINDMSNKRFAYEDVVGLLSLATRYDMIKDSEIFNILDHIKGPVMIGSWIDKVHSTLPLRFDLFARFNTPAADYYVKTNINSADKIKEFLQYYPGSLSVTEQPSKDSIYIVELHNLLQSMEDDKSRKLLLQRLHPEVIGWLKDYMTEDGYMNTLTLFSTPVA